MTFLDLKNRVANCLGKTDGSTANIIRDNAINNVRRGEIANAYPFSWLRKAATLTTDANGQDDLPADFNPTHKIYDLREVITGQDIIYYEHNRTTWDTPTCEYFYIDFNTSTNLWRINTSTVSKTLQIIYYAIPATLSGDSDVDIIPDPDCVAFLASSRYWLSSERDETNHDRFRALGQQQLRTMIQRDKRAHLTRDKRGTAYTVDMGYNLGD